MEADPDDLYQLLRAGERALRAGAADEATKVLRKATAIAPYHVDAWQKMGDALAATDRSAARQAWQQAFRCAKLPLPWPGAPCLDPDVFRQIASAFTEPEPFERELAKFLSDQVRDVGSAREATVAWGAARELSRSLTRRGLRTRARDVLSDLLARTRRFAHAETPWSAVLELARLEFDLGHHDESEALLRRVRREAAPEWHGSASLILARIAITRQEPWAEEILDEARAGDLSDEERIDVGVLAVERASRQDRADLARLGLDEARKYGLRVASRTAQALLCLAEADVLRLTGDAAGAVQSIRRGLGTLQDRDDAELKFRLLIRHGDLLSLDGRSERVADAVRAWQIAADGFRTHELPVREAWALLRLARYARDPGPMVAAARDRFAEADLAAGVAASDALSGDPAASLAWHLDRGQAQTRARFDAQRARPPWERADAERPERRIGAHRLAIAACPDAVVHALAAEMAACARAISTGRGRALDPPVMRYVAAVDLLSAHRSYTAAEVLLEHLLQAPVDGTARRALQGAVARSPNAALVDGLLSVVENASQFPADAVGLAAETLGLRREKAAVNALAALAAPGMHPISRKAAVSALGRIGDRAAVDHVIPALDDPTLAESAALALLLLGNRHGIDFHGRALHEGRTDLSGSPGEIVGRYGGPAHLPLLIGVAESGTDDRALGALQGLGLLGDPRAIPALIKALSSRDRRTIEIAAGALQIVTGHAEQMDEAGAKGRWAAWWEANEGKMKPGMRHRDGRPFDGALLIEKMTLDDAWIRRTAYDELVIVSGGNLPFDAEGPWRVQQAHLRAWRDWWKKNGARLLPGRWYLDGLPIH